MSRRLRIGYFMYAPRLGGAEGYLRDLISRIDRKRFSVTLLAPPWAAFDAFVGLSESADTERVDVTVFEPGTQMHRRPLPVAASRSGHGIEAPPSFLRRLSHHLPAGKRIAPTTQWILRQAYWPLNVHRLASVFGNAQLDLLHSVNGGYPGATSARAAIAAAKAAGVPGRVLTVCSTPMPRAGIRSVEANLDRKVFTAADAVIVPAATPRSALVHQRGCPPELIRTIPWGVDAPAPPDDRQAAKRAARIHLGLEPDGELIGVLANFTPTKGQIDVIEAMAALTRRVPGVRAALGGEGPERERVEARSRQLGLSTSVRFLGPVENAFTFLRALDVFVLASHIEGLPLVILEAMSQGVPVIASDVGGIAEAVTDHTTGLLIRPKAPAQIVEAVETILLTPGLARSMGVAARLAFERRFTMDVMIRSHEDLYEAVVEGAPRGGLSS